ncbi:MAG: hypothetical protein JWN98_712 [Abditibacteriota bacterium]|nr:hypothetical protein [Abditibacteriota bacterium]
MSFFRTVLVAYVMPCTIVSGALVPGVGTQAQTPPHSSVAAALLPALELQRSISGRETIVTLRWPEGMMPQARTRIALFERGRPARLAEVRRDWTNQNGRWQTTLRLEADPGQYELRVLSDDKARTPLLLPSALLVPGLDREPGWWLFNGSPFVEATPQSSEPAAASTLATGTTIPSAITSAITPTTPTPVAPLFVPGLQRDLNRRAKTVSANRLISGDAPLRWNVLSLPPLPLQNAAAPALSDVRLDVTAFRAQLTAALREAVARGERNLAGVAVPAPRFQEASAANTALMRAVRQVVNEAAPGAALILDVRFPSAEEGPGEVLTQDSVARWTEASAPLCDAVLLHIAPQTAGAASTLSPAVAARLWAVKAARRIAEEQPAYDLPIWVQWEESAARTASAANSSPRAAQALDLFMAGTTGFIGGEGELLAWQRMVERNLSLFVGSVTLEDAGLLPAPAVASMATGGDVVELYRKLRSIGRIPLLARTQLPRDERRAESIMVRLGDQADQSTLNALRAVASAGGRVYIEGAPLRDEKKQLSAAFATLVNATITEAAAKPSTMVLDDVWTFGTTRGAAVPIEQRVVAAMKPMLSNARKKKDARGVDELTEPRVLAKLADGSPALIQIPIGDGQILWSPNPVPLGTSPAQTTQAVAAVEQFYAAIAGLIQPALVQVREASASAENNANGSTSGIARGVRVALRASPKGTLLLGLFNESNRERSVLVEAQAGAEAALDLALDEDVAVRRRGFSSAFEATLPAGGWKLFALAASRRVLEDERDAPRLKVRLR